ncbi:MAG: cytochrome c, partial [Acidobacteriota bacterium]
MKRMLRWLSIVVVVLLVAVAALVGYVYVVSSRLMARTYSVGSLPSVTVPTDPAALARGKYLTEHVAVCVECHGEDLGGKLVDDNFAMGRIQSANLTRGQGGIGASYTDQDFVRTIMHGVKRDGHSVVYMPSGDYRFTSDDLGAILGYVRSVPPVDRVPAPMSIGPMARTLGLFTDFP